MALAEAAAIPAMPEEFTNGTGIGALKAWAPSDKDIETIAHIAHEANRAICVANSDLSQPSWEDAPDWQKNSAIEGVKFHLANPYANARDSHDKWMETKLRDGWRYGPVKDVAKKEHPCLLPHKSLPAHEQLKDDVFSAIVKGYLEGLRRAHFN